jgi:predicted RNase H-like HicB family nuclease/DNA-binding XRE family transcriptional regulator
VHKENKGYWAECCELRGCVTQADSPEELRAACGEALNLYLEEPDNSGIIFPLPDEGLNRNRKLLQVKAAPEIAVAVLLRNFRLKAKMTQKQAAEMLGMKNIYSYQRLERKSNPTLNILDKIHAVFPGVKLDYLFQ